MRHPQESPRAVGKEFKRSGYELTDTIAECIDTIRELSVATQDIEAKIEMIAWAGKAAQGKLQTHYLIAFASPNHTVH
ncbi:hypothetical protein [Hymenobacter ruricola]|uniref:Uncharacterized protein n=1 Tax=Hymenobacter ruricola TaxID=2791023 RepID=A0ABS0I3D4_9BACT|nr:hypothetical protein [Hymenobacter ruricola]MBF9221102.1 hypothetical protein [Hymenobacter ruricola]